MVTESLLFHHAYGPVPDNGCARRKRRQAPNAYTPTFFDNLNFTNAQRTLCENNRQCLYDLFITQDNDVAQTTLDTEKKTNMTIATLSKININNVNCLINCPIYMYLQLIFHQTFQLKLL